GGPRVLCVGRDGQVQVVAVLGVDEVGDAQGGGVGGGGVGVADGDVHVPRPGLGLRLVGHAAQQLRGVDRADVPCLTHAAEVLVALLADHDVVLQGEHGVGGFAEDGGPVDEIGRASCRRECGSGGGARREAIG